MLVVGRSDFQQASQLFAGFEIKIVSGSQFLRGFVGEDTLTVVFASSKVYIWSCCACQLANVAVSQPQAAHAVLAKSLQYE